jgi:hypothetical protein
VLALRSMAISSFRFFRRVRDSKGWQRHCIYLFSSMLCGSLLEDINRMASLPFRFLTPFPHRPSRRLRNSQGSDQVIRRHAAFSPARKACSPRGSALLLPSVEEPCPLRLFTRPSS